jgi:ATP-dependent Clp protease ATP-binding subunit ClpC
MMCRGSVALQKYIEDALSEAPIQGTLPRPSELEVYLGDTGLFVRPIKETEEELVGAGSSAPSPGVALYTA